MSPLRVGRVASAVVAIRTAAVLVVGAAVALVLWVLFGDPAVRVVIVAIAIALLGAIIVRAVLTIVRVRITLRALDALLRAARQRRGLRDEVGERKLP